MNVLLYYFTVKKKNHTLIEVTSSSLEEILPITIATPLFERGNVRFVYYLYAAPC